MGRLYSRLLACGLLSFAFAGSISAQSAGSDRAPTVPPGVPFTGTVAGMQGPVTVAFSVYADQTGGTPLWTETQNITCDARGRFTVVLGDASPGGLPPEVFTTGSGRWLAVEPLGAIAELPRVALLTVPYAARAASADTIGGKPPSAFVQVGNRSGVGPDGVVYVNPRVAGTALISTTTAGTTGYIGMFTSSVDLGNSIIFQNAGSIGVNTTAPAAPLHLVASVAPGGFFDVYSNNLDALPVVNRAARGTPAAPAAVRTDDILGGLAVRGFDGTSFSPGQGQVMFRAAQSWTKTAHGTYLEFTTTPLGATSYVERMRIDSAGTVRVGGTTQIGSETGTTEAPTVANNGPYVGLVMRRINSINATAGTIVARTDYLNLERDGTAGGFRITVIGTLHTLTVACMGIDATGNAVNKVIFAPSGTMSVYTDAQSVVYFHCSIGYAYVEGHHAELTLFREIGDNFWVGTVISTYNQ